MPAPAPRSQPRGFTLIEVMVVVAILGILSTIAIPQMQRFALRSKRAEREMMVRAIVRSVQQFRHSEPRDITGVTLQQNPPSAATTGRAAFDRRIPSGDAATAGWDRLDFVPTAPVYLRYSGAATFPADGSGGTFTLVVDGDLDADGLVSTVSYAFRWEGEAWVQDGEPVQLGDDW